MKKQDQLINDRGVGGAREDNNALNVQKKMRGEREREREAQGMACYDA